MPSFRTSDQVQIHYEVAGAPSLRPPLVLIHGFPLDSRLWADVTPAVTAHGQVILPDLRGFGQSAVPAGPYTMERYAQDVAELIRKLNLKRVFVGGHSMGGYVALALAERYPELVAGLALIYSHPYADDENARAGRYATADTVLKGDRKAWDHALLPKMLAGNASDRAVGKIEIMIEQQNSRAVAAASAGMALRPDREFVWRSFTGASLLIAGRQDAMFPHARMERTRAARMSVLYRELDTGHVGMVERPGECADALFEWWLPLHHRSS
jgi:pimeloyl-ACP methyl ester carboxylesterase